MKILVVEDEVPLLESLSSFIRQEGHTCEISSGYLDASQKIDLYNYDLLILDVGLPDGNGLDLIPQLKSRCPETGVLILSAKSSMDDKVAGLDSGADDYLGKPFHLAELNARIRAIYRRRFFSGREKLEFGNIELRLSEKIALVNNEPIELTRKEFELLEFFLTNPNRVLSKESIAEHLWGDAIDSSDSFDFVYSHIKNIRKKICEKGGIDCIKTIYGLGYKYLVE